MNAIKKKKRLSRPKSSIGRKILLTTTALVVLIGAGGAVFLSTFDLDTYRTQIADSASQALGRKVALDGPLSFSLTFQRGLTLAAADVAVSNPAWASRPLMARIGKVFVHVDWMKLIDKKLDIIAFDLEKADILLETRADGANNWTFASAKDKPASEAGAEVQAATGSPVSIGVREAAITDSRFGLLGKDGKLTIFDVPRLVFTENGKGIKASFKGSIGGVATTLELTGGKLAAISGENWPFELEAAYGPLSLAARGAIKDGVKTVVLDPVSVQSGGSSLGGALTVSLAGARPSIAGHLKGKTVDPSDFALGGSGAEAPQVKGKAAGGDAKLFSRDPLPFDGLRAVDLDLSLAIDELKAGVMPLRSVIVPVKLAAGRLNVAPFSTIIGGSKTTGRLGVDASQSNAQVSLALDAKDADMGQVLSLWGLEAVITGKADLDAKLNASGRSLHDLAATSNGTFDIDMDAGQVSTSAARSVASGVLDLFVAPGAGNLTSPGVNCVAGRYVITNGLVQTKGLLIDTEVTTISGQGTVNLPDEHINMNLYTRPKALGLTAALPPMKVYGDLTGPSFTLDTAAVAQKVVGLLTSSSTGSVVPTLVSVPKGQNACAVTLDNPAAARAAESQGDKKTLLPSTGSLQDKIKGVGGKLLRGLGSSLLGQ